MESPTKTASDGEPRKGGLPCPRCGISLERRRDASDEVDVHACTRCGGWWVNGVDVVWLYPALKSHGRRIHELVERGARRDTSIDRCPYGHRDALEFPFFDVSLDLCETCHGLWLDGDEIRFVGKTAIESDGLPSDDETMNERVDCVLCKKSVHPRRTLVTADGAVCDGCAELEASGERLEAAQPMNKLRRAPGKLLQVIGKVLDADGKRLKRSGFTTWLR
jgi:Zn-finger nucleic acid-binding protein